MQPEKKLFFRTSATTKDCSHEDMRIKVSLKYMSFL